MNKINFYFQTNKKLKKKIIFTDYDYQFNFIINNI